MWHLSDGTRTLADEEWALLVAGLEDLVTSVEDDLWFTERETRTGVPMFDALTTAQQIALLADVATALRDPTVAAPAHTLTTDGAIAAVFAKVRELLNAELNDEPARGEETLIRGLIRGTYRNSKNRSRPLPPATRQSPDAWEVLLEEIEARVYWDRGYGRGVYDPVDARHPSEGDPEYYRDAPRTPNEKGVIKARQVLARLMGAPVPDHKGLFPALFDFYHDFIVGPLPPKAPKGWDERNWVRVGWRFLPDWNCDYPTWLKEMRSSVPSVPFTVLPTMPDPPVQKRGRGRPTKAQAPSLPSDIQVVKCGKDWVIRHQLGYWSDLLDEVWGEEEGALRFPSEDEATAAFVQATQMHKEREGRCREMRARLGLPETDPSESD